MARSKKEATIEFMDETIEEKEAKQKTRKYSDIKKEKSAAKKKADKDVFVVTKPEESFNSEDEFITGRMYTLHPLKAGCHGITDERLRSSVLRHLRKEGAIMSPILWCNGEAMYFDRNEVCRIDKGNVFFKDKKITWSHHLLDPELWKMATSKLGVGMTFKDCVETYYLEQRPKNPKDKQSITDSQNSKSAGRKFAKAQKRTMTVAEFVDSIVLSIRNIDIEKDAYGFINNIYCTVFMPRYSFEYEELEAIIKKFKSQILAYVRKEIESYSSFKSNGLDFVDFKLDKATLNPDHTWDLSWARVKH